MEIVIFFVALGAAALGIVIVVLAISLQKERERAIRLEMAAMRMPSDAGQRFDRTEQSLEGIALEVERLAEAQRFSARVLAEVRPGLIARDSPSEDPASR